MLFLILICAAAGWLCGAPFDQKLDRENLTKGAAKPAPKIARIK